MLLCSTTLAAHSILVKPRSRVSCALSTLQQAGIPLPARRAPLAVGSCSRCLKGSCSGNRRRHSSQQQWQHSRSHGLEQHAIRRPPNAHAAAIPSTDAAALGCAECHLRKPRRKPCWLWRSRPWRQPHARSAAAWPAEVPIAAAAAGCTGCTMAGSQRQQQRAYRCQSAGGRICCTACGGGA
jgi:hypothetical protein